MLNLSPSGANLFSLKCKQTCPASSLASPHLALLSVILASQKLRVPCAHAPALPPIDADESVSPRACAEELGYTFLPCVLSNLHRCEPRGCRRADGAIAADVYGVAADASLFCS